MIDNLKIILDEISKSHGFQTLLVVRDMKKLFTDTDLDEETQETYLDFITESDTNADTIEKLMTDFRAYTQDGSDEPLLSVLKEIEADHGFQTLLVVRDMKKLFTDTDLDEELTSKYLEFVPNATSRDVKSLYNEFKTWKPKKVSEIKKEETVVKPANKVRRVTEPNTRFEKARIIGARALQISYGAPILVDGCEDMLDPIDIALKEYEEGVIPITVLRRQM